MNRSVLFGAVIVGFALSLGGLVSLALYRWEQGERAGAEAVGVLGGASPPAILSGVSSPTEPRPSPAVSGPTESLLGKGPPASGSVATQPVPETASRAVEGQALFGRLCDACHPGAEAGLGPALMGSAFEAKFREDAGLIDVIRQGEKGMPSFSASRLSEDELADILAYIRSLGAGEPGAAEGKPVATSTEVAVRGEMTWTGSYLRDIQQVFDAFCVRCHGSTLAENGLRLDSYDGVIHGTQGGAIVVPGSASSSTLVWVIQGLAAPEIRMPHAEHPLSPNRIQNIILWIDAGASDD